MKYKYAKKPVPKPYCGTGRIPGVENPKQWITGPDPITHDKYYAYLKHRAQRKFRNEEYQLSWEDWQQLWPDDLFLKRGRGRDDLCLMLKDLSEPWHVNNVAVVPRIEQLARSKEYRSND